MNVREGDLGRDARLTVVGKGISGLEGRIEEQAIPATGDELAKRRAAALRAWLEREMGTERAALTALLAKHGVKMKVGLSTTRTSRLI